MLFVLLPAYNEEKGLGSVLPALIRIRGEHPATDLKVVVVDDGSGDRTSEVATSFRDRLDLHLIRFSVNRGVCEVFRAGFEYILAQSRNPEQDVCVILDSDNTQDPDLIPRMHELVSDGTADLVIASRFAPGGKMVGCPWQRQLFSYGLLFLMRALVRVPNARDYSTFYRAYRIDLLKRGFAAYGPNLLDGAGFAVMGGLLVKLANLTGRIVEVPLVLRYDQKEGASGIKLAKTVRGYIGLIWRSVATRRFRTEMRPRSSV